MNTSPPLSPLDQARPSTKGTANRLPEAATTTFEHYFVNVAQNVKKPQVDEWAKEYRLKGDSIRQWFQRRRVKLKSVSQATATQSAPNPVAQSNLNEPNLAHLPQDDEDSDEQAAKQSTWFELEHDVALLAHCNTEFHYLAEEKIIRLLAYFKDRRLNLRHLTELAEQLGVPSYNVLEFAKWKATRELACLGYETGTSHNNSLSPTRSTPLASETHRSPSVVSVKMEVDEAAASLPTPQPSVGLSPSPSRTQSIEPDPVYVSFYETWLSARASPLETSDSSAGASPSSILQKHLPPSIAQFAYGSSNAT